MILSDDSVSVSSNKEVYEVQQNNWIHRRLLVEFFPSWFTSEG